MSTKEFFADQMHTLTNRQINKQQRQFAHKSRQSFEKLELRKTQPIKISHSRLKSSNPDVEIWKQQDAGLLNDYSNIETISTNYMRLTKKSMDKKGFQIQSNLNDTYNTTRDRSIFTNAPSSIGRQTHFQNSTQMKFLKIETNNSVLQNSATQSFQKQDSTRSAQNPNFVLNQNSLLFREDSIYEGKKRKFSQSISSTSNNRDNTLILKDLFQKQHGANQSSSRDEYQYSQMSDKTQVLNSGLSHLNQGNIIKFGGSSLNQSQSSQLINSKTLEKINSLRKEGLKLKPNENFYMQLISNDDLTLPKYEKSFSSIRREKFLENIKLDLQKSNSNSNLKSLPNLLLEDGSILEIDKVKILTDNLQKTHRLALHNSQNSQFRKPDERKDIKLLSDWLDEMIHKVYTEQITSYYDFYEKFELIFDGAISEISRQLQNECQERAQLLRKIWSIYSSVISEFFQKTQKTNIKIEAENFKRINNVHKMYLTDIQNQNEMIRDLREKIEIKENYMNKLRSENRYLRKKWKKLEKGNEYLQQDLEQQLQNYEETVKENQILKMKIEGILMTQQNEFIDQFNRNDIQDRFNDEMEKVRNNLFDHFSKLYEEQKTKLEEAYSVRQDLKEKEILLAQKVEEEDEEYEKNRSKDNGNDYENILDNKCIDTSDLIQTTSISIDTSTLYQLVSVECQATPEGPRQFNKSVQATVQTKSLDTQVDLRRLVKENSSLTEEQQAELIMLNKNFPDYVHRQFYLNLKNAHKIQDIGFFSMNIQNFLTSCGQLLSKIQQKEEFNYHDTEAIGIYVNQNIKEIEEFIERLFTNNKTLSVSINSLQLNNVERRLEISVQSNRVILYHLYIQQIYQSGGISLDQYADELKEDPFYNSQKLNQETGTKNGYESPSVNKSSFYSDKFRKASKNIMIGVQFQKEAQTKRGLNQEEKMESYNKYKNITQEFEDNLQFNTTDNQSNPNNQKVQNNLFTFDQNDILKEETPPPSLQITLAVSQRLSSFKKTTNSSISENSLEDNLSDRERDKHKDSENSGESDSEGSSNIINTDQQIQAPVNPPQINSVESNLVLLTNSENQNQQTDRSFNNSVNILSPSCKTGQQLQSGQALSRHFSQDNQFDLQFQEQLSTPKILRIRQDSDFSNRRNSSVMNQLVDNARFSQVLDSRKSSIIQSPQKIIQQITKKVPDIQIFDESSNTQKLGQSPKNSPNASFSSNAPLTNIKQKMTTSELLRELNFVTQVDNIFNRLRVYKNSNKTTKEATQVIEKVMKKISKKKENKIIDLKDQKQTTILKTFGNIMIDLMKYLKKNVNSTFPHFHSFSFEYFINNYGYSQQTEKKFKEIVENCFQLKGQHNRINLYFKLLVGEIDYVDYKFLLEVIQKIDDTGQNGIGVVSNTNEKSFIGWSKVYEFFMQYFGQVIPLKSYQTYDRQIQLMKNKQQQSNKILINSDDAIELMMNIYSQELKSNFCLNYQDLYDIVDIYDTNFMTLDQFYLLYYSIEPREDQISKSQLTQIFMQEHDLQLYIADSQKLKDVYDESVKLYQQFTNYQLAEYGISNEFIYGLSIFRFCQICIDYEFLSLSKQSVFLEYSIDAQVAQLRLQFESKIEQIKKRLIKCNKYNIQYHLQIKSVQRYLDLEAESTNHFHPMFRDKQLENTKQVLLTYKLLESISQQLYAEYVIEQELLLPQMQLLQNAFTQTNLIQRNRKNKNQ